MDAAAASTRNKVIGSDSEVPSARPPFHSGDRLTRAEFERRYQAYPEIKKAELIEGVVYMPSPARFRHHANPHGNILAWLGFYCGSTPGSLVGIDATVRLDYENEVQPDALLRLDEEIGGKSAISDDDYLEGPPELTVEIAASSVSYDLNQKKRSYARSGVPEYLAVQMYERRIDWFVLREGVYDILGPGEDGILKSEIFPGLWLLPDAFWSNDLAKVLSFLQQGLDSPEHKDFLARLHAKQKP